MTTARPDGQRLTPSLIGLIVVVLVGVHLYRAALVERPIPYLL